MEEVFCIYVCVCVCMRVCMCVCVSEREQRMSASSERSHRIAYIQCSEWVDLLVKVEFGRLVSEGAVPCVMGCILVAGTHINISLGLSTCGAWFSCIDHHSSIPYAAFHSFGLAPGNKIGLCLEQTAFSLFESRSRSTAHYLFLCNGSIHTWAIAVYRCNEPSGR